MTGMAGATMVWLVTATSIPSTSPTKMMFRRIPVVLPATNPRSVLQTLARGRQDQTCPHQPYGCLTYHEPPDYPLEGPGVVDVRERFVRHAYVEELAQRFPAFLDLVDEQSFGRDPLDDLLVMPFEDPYSVPAVLEFPVERLLP